MEAYYSLSYASRSSLRGVISTTGVYRTRQCCVVLHHQGSERNRLQIPYFDGCSALTWGRRCDGFLGFSNVTTSNLGLLRLDHVGPETYGNMHQKVRSIWDHNHYGLALKRNLLSQGRNIIRERSVHVGKK